MGNCTMYNQSLPKISKIYKTTISLSSLLHRIRVVTLIYNSTYPYLVYFTYLYLSQWAGEVSRSYLNYLRNVVSQSIILFYWWATTTAFSSILGGPLASAEKFLFISSPYLTCTLLAAVSVYPPNDCCLNSNCTHHGPLKKEYRKKAVVYTNNNGVQPSWNTSIYCPSESFIMSSIEYTY